jgi:hypothetical protein
MAVCRDSHDFTPPGYGKPQTIKRNERRRRKRMHELQRGSAATSEEAAAPAGVSTSNATPLGDREVPTPSPAAPLSSGTAGSSRGTTSYMMSSLSNKNKRRGYKEAPDVLPPKIVFGDDTNVEPEQLPGSAGSVLTNHLPRLIPPSERQDRGDIPESWKLFVTSIDVEDGMPRRGKKRKQKQAQQWESQLDEGGDVEVVTALDYGGPEDDVVVPSGSVAHSRSDVSSLDWHGVEQRLPDLTLVDSPLLLKSGITVAWKVSDDGLLSSSSHKLMLCRSVEPRYQPGYVHP